MRELGSAARPRLLLYTARYQYRHKNAVAATLAWMAETRQYSFDVYYDAMHAGRHYGGSDPGDTGLWGAQAGFWLLTGGLVSGGRHLEAAALALQRFQTTAICSGEVALSNLLSTIDEKRCPEIYTVGEDNIAYLYATVFSALGLP